MVNAGCCSLAPPSPPSDRDEEVSVWDEDGDDDALLEEGPAEGEEELEACSFGLGAELPARREDEACTSRREDDAVAFLSPALVESRATALTLCVAAHIVLLHSRSLC